MSTQHTPSRRTRKIAAIAAGALVVGLGATYTLATWNDSEWVWGGADGVPGVGTDTFEVQQNTTSPFTDAPADWADRETNPGGGLTFTAGAISLSPGDTVYAPVALRTTAESSSATVTLREAVPAAGVTAVDEDQDLWKSIRVTVYTETRTTPAAPTNACDAANASAWGVPLISDVPLDTAAPATQTVDAEAGSTQHYCFALHLPTTLQPGVAVTALDDLQGRTIAPAWEFRSISG
ncbi:MULTISPECIES: hypothetical protein [Leucobacter]|uniref:hypothetical protein n=1 Tax=Leucobacter TaxID=55968 RepID=UPI0003A25FE9|nr:MULTISPECIES: hypothetical protein [Leucobacter]